jgi:tetratricopeptide (TPR) repeat protein
VERRCSELLREGHAERALEELVALVQAGDDNAWAHAHLGDLLCVARGEHEAALRHLSRAIELDESYAWAFAHRGAVFERLDRFDEAGEDFRRALELNPSNVWARAMLCRVHQFCGRYDSAISELEVVIREGSALLPDWRAERGLLQTLAGRYELAHSLYLEALAHDARDRLALYNVAVNKVQWQGLAAAAEWVERARENLRTYPAMQSRTSYELGGLKALEGDADAAFVQLALAIDAERGRVLLSPSFKRARVDLAWARLREHPRFVSLTQDRVDVRKAQRKVSSP